jgi:CoA-transferase family III
MQLVRPIIMAISMLSCSSADVLVLPTFPDLEAAAAEAGLPMALCQTEASWAAHPQGSHLGKLPWVPVERHPSSLSGPPPSPYSFLPAYPPRPLSGLRVLCVTHAIAGPSTGRTLAEHGASVLQIMFTHGFEHSFVYTYANLGTASSRLNLHKQADRERLQTLVKDAHVWLDSYRPNAISKFGFSNNDIRTLNPSIILCRLRVYGTTGPWKSKPGFDMQGSASSGLMSLMGQGQGDGRPQWPPGMVINDYTTGYSAALAIQSIILKRVKGEVDVRDGWLVSPSLCGTAMGILKYYKTSRFGSPADQEGVEALPPEILEAQTSLGYFKILAPLPKMSETPIHYAFGPLHTMGSDPPVFPGYDDGYDVRKVMPMSKGDILHEMGGAVGQKLEWLKTLGERLRGKRDEMEEEVTTSG